MTVRAKASWGVPLGLAFIALVAAIDWLLLRVLFVRQIPNEEINLLTFVVGLLVLLSLPVLAVLAYHTLNCATLRYRLDRNGIVIQRGGRQWVVPIGDIQEIQPGSQVTTEIVHRRGVRWPGYEQGEGRLPGIGRVQFLSTRPLAEQLLLLTPAQVFTISPADIEGFAAAFRERQELGPNRVLDREVRRAAWLSWPFWTDRVAWLLLGVGLILNLLLFGYLAFRFPRLDLQLPLHFSSLGAPDRIGSRIELFTLPIIGLIILGTNLALGVALYKRERAGSYLLWGAASGVQIFFWLAILTLVP